MLDVGGALEVMKDERVIDVLATLNSVFIFSYTFLFIRFGSTFLSLDLTTRLVLSIAISATICVYIVFITGIFGIKISDNSLYAYCHCTFLLMLCFTLLAYISSNYTIPSLIKEETSNSIMFTIIYIGIILSPLITPKLFKLP